MSKKSKRSQAERQRKLIAEMKGRSPNGGLPMWAYKRTTIKKKR